MIETRLAYTREEAALACGVSLDTIKRAINAGRLRAKRSSEDEDGNPTGKYLITPAAISEWLEGLTDA